MPFVFHVHCLFHIECIRVFFHINLVWFSRLPGSFVALLLHYQSFTISFEPQCYTLDSNIHFFYIFVAAIALLITSHDFISVWVRVRALTWSWMSVCTGQSICTSVAHRFHWCASVKETHAQEHERVHVCEWLPLGSVWKLPTFDSIDVIITVHQTISQRFIHIALRIIASYLHNSNQDAASVSFKKRLRLILKWMV